MERRGLSRRALVGGGLGVAATAAIGTRGIATTQAAGTAPAAGCPLLPPERIGLQLYSLRTAIAEQGFAPVLETVAEIGFKQVEFAGYTQGSSPEITLEELRGLLDANGLVAAASHVSPGDDASMERILDEAEVLGIPRVGISLLLPAGVPTASGWREAAAQYNRFGELAAERGVGFYLHNHFQEWLPVPDAPSKRGMDVLLEETDPRLVSFEFDIFWAYVGAAQSGGGFDPLTDYAIPHRRRIELFHVKDGIPERAEILDVGEGEIDFQAFFTKLFEQSRGEERKHLYLWERDNADDHPRGPLAAARSSFVNMRHGLVAGEGGDACSPGARPLRATIASAGVRRAATGARRLHVDLRLNRGARVVAELTRDGETLLRTARRVHAGRGTLEVAVPRSVPGGRARLEVTVADGAGSSLRLRDAVRLPGRRRA